MTICRKCGKEIPDGEELCEECKQGETNSGESYLDELMQSVEVDDSVQEPPVSDESNEDVDELLALLSQDYEDYEEESSVEMFQDEDDVISMDEDAVNVSPELSFFSQDDDDSIFADDTEIKDIDDIFDDALSAVEYSEGEEDFVSLNEEEDVSVVDDMETLDSMPNLMDMEEDLIEEVPEETEPKEEKPSMWQKVFGNIITEQTPEEEAREREKEEKQAQERAQAKEEKKKKAEEEKAEKAEQAKEEKERKKAEKAELAAVKAANKEEKKRLRLEREANEVVGRINPVGAAIVMVFFGVICLIAVLGTQSLSYSGAVRTAESALAERDYESAYEALAGVDVSEDDAGVAMKARLCMQLQKQINSYENYYELKMYVEALDSLMKGIRKYDENHDIADEYEILQEYNELELEVAKRLHDEFGVDEITAREINSIESRRAYTEKLESIIAEWELEGMKDRQ